MTFLTEKETEELLVQETRNIKNLDGTNRAFTQSRLWWDKYEYLIYTTDFHPIRLTEEAMKAAHEFNKSFEYSMREMVIALHYEYRTLRDS